MNLDLTTPPTGPAAPRRFLPVLLVLFVGSGCAALIYEVVWLQLLQLVIGSTAVSLGVLLGTFMGGMCAGQPAAAAPRLGPAAPPAGLRPARAGHRRHRARGAVRHAVCRTGVRALRRPRPAGHPAARGRGRGVPAAAHAADGRDAAGDRALGRDRPRGGVVAGLLLRRQHRRGRVRLPAGRLLPAARPRHGHGHLRRRRPQCDRGRDRPGPGGRPGPVRGAGRPRDEGGAQGARPAPGPCIWRSPSPGCRRWAPRWSGPACSR